MGSDQLGPVDMWVSEREAEPLENVGQRRNSEGTGCSTEGAWVVGGGEGEKEREASRVTARVSA